MNIDTAESRFRSRKFALALLIQIPATLALFVSYEVGDQVIRVLEGGSYSQLSIANISAYSLANAAEYFTKMRKAQAEAANAQPSA